MPRRGWPGVTPANTACATCYRLVWGRQCSLSVRFHRDLLLVPLPGACGRPLVTDSNLPAPALASRTLHRYHSRSPDSTRLRTGPDRFGGVLQPDVGEPRDRTRNPGP